MNQPAYKRNCTVSMSIITHAISPSSQISSIRLRHILSTHSRTFRSLSERHNLNPLIFTVWRTKIPELILKMKKPSSKLVPSSKNAQIRIFFINPGKDQSSWIFNYKNANYPAAPILCGCVNLLFLLLNTWILWTCLVNCLKHNTVTESIRQNLHLFSYKRIFGENLSLKTCHATVIQEEVSHRLLVCDILKCGLTHRKTKLLACMWFEAKPIFTYIAKPSCGRNFCKKSTENASRNLTFLFGGDFLCSCGV